MQHELTARTGINQLVLLNIVLQTQDQVASSIPKHRLVLFVKHILEWCKGDSTSISTQAECCKALTKILPSVQDVYGSHWSETVTCLTNTWLNAQGYSVGNIWEGG